MPLIRAAGSVPDDHRVCREGGTECVECAARRELRPEDWEIVTFFRKVEDQVVSLPSGLPSPRLEGWLAACDLHEIPREERPWYVEMARLVFALVHGEAKARRSSHIADWQLAPPWE